MKKHAWILTAMFALALALSFARPVLATTADESDLLIATETTDETESEDSTTSTKAMAAAAVVAVVAAAGAIGMAIAISRSVTGMSRQPEASGQINSAMMLGLVFIETAIIYALIVAILIIFVL